VISFWSDTIMQVISGMRFPATGHLIPNKITK